MDPEQNAALQSSDDDRSPTISRRRTLRLGLAVTSVSLAGCISDGTEEPEEKTADDETADDESDDPVDIVYAYFEAAIDEDIDRMSSLSHSQNPLDPTEWVEDGWEFRGGGDEDDLDEVDIEVIDSDATVDDLFELEGAAFWFEEEELAADLDGEDLATVEITDDDPTEDDMIWLLATEDGEWRYLFAGPSDDTPDDPEAVFEEPIEDTDDDVVVEIDWEHETSASDETQAAVVLTEERGIDANRIEVDSVIEGGHVAAYDRDDEDFTARWENITLYVPYDSEGDQIVVTAINAEADDQTIVHREQYLP